MSPSEWLSLLDNHMALCGILTHPKTKTKAAALGTPTGSLTGASACPLASPRLLHQGLTLRGNQHPQRLRVRAPGVGGPSSSPSSATY